MTPSIRRLILAEALRTFNFAGPIFTMALMLPVIGAIADWSLRGAFITVAALILVGSVVFRVRARDVVVT